MNSPGVTLLTPSAPAPLSQIPNRPKSKGAAQIAARVLEFLMATFLRGCYSPTLQFNSPTSAASFSENFAQAARHDHILAGLEHPNAHHDGVNVRRHAGRSPGVSSGGGVQF